MFKLSGLRDPARPSMRLASPAPTRDPAVAQLALREDVLRSILFWFRLGGVLKFSVVLAQLLKHSAPITLWIAAVLLLLLAAFVFLQPRLGFERTARAFLGYLLAVCGYLQCFRGMIPGTVLAD